MEKILIVDDMSINRMILADMLEEEYEVEEADNGRDALEILADRHDEFNLVLLDLIMPKVSGFEVLEAMAHHSWLDTIPVIVISGEDSKEVEEKSLILGASDFVHKPFDESVVKRRVKNTADLYNYKKSLENKVEEQTRELHEQYEQLLQQSKRLEQNNKRLMDVLGMVVEYRDLESGEHVQRVRTYTELLAREAMKRYPDYGLTEEQVQKIAEASVLHDLGKIAIPDNVLLKPGRLTKEEFEQMKTHAAKGGEILLQIKDAWEDDFGDICYQICRHHHEKYDGRGYPDGLAGEDIPLSAQLVSIADVYDALVTDRVYKKAFSTEQAFEMITNGDCGTFSPKLMQCFRQVKPQFEEVVAKQKEQEKKEREKKEREKKEGEKKEQ